MARETPTDPVREPDADMVSPEEPPSDQEPEEAVPARQASQRSSHRTHDRPKQRPSSNRMSRRQYADYPSNDSVRSSRPLRYRDDYWDDRDDYDEYDDPDRAYDRYWRDEGRHPDFFQDRRSRTARPRPPRAYRNRPAPSDEFNPNGRPYPDESRRSVDRGTLFPATPRRVPAMDEEQGMARLEWGDMTSAQKAEVLRIPWTQWMNSSFKNHFVATIGEFIGTTLFLLFAFAGTEVANIQSKAVANTGSDSNTTTGAATGFNVGVLLYISLIFSFSLMVNV